MFWKMHHNICSGRLPNVIVKTLEQQLTSRHCLTTTQFTENNETFQPTCCSVWNRDFFVFLFSSRGSFPDNFFRSILGLPQCKYKFSNWQRNPVLSATHDVCNEIDSPTDGDEAEDESSETATSGGRAERTRIRSAPVGHSARFPPQACKLFKFASLSAIDEATH